MLVDVVPMLVVPVAVVQVVLMVTVRDRLTAIAGRVDTVMGGVDLLRWVSLVVMDRVDVIAVRHSRAPVARQVLVVSDFDVLSAHRRSLLLGAFVQTPRHPRRRQAQFDTSRAGPEPWRSLRPHWGPQTNESGG